MKTLVLMLALLGFAPGLAQAQAGTGSAFYEIDAAALPQVKGVVRKVDPASLSITLKHEEIPNLDMPPMTMPYKVAATEMLDGINPGDKVLFTADLVNGDYTIMSIEKR